jgi:recombinational DNA repair protein (RecF pathway)
MAWSTGASIFAEVAETIFRYVPDEDDRKMIYKELVELFLDYDCDNLDECANIDFMLDEVLIEEGIIEDVEEE